MNKATPERRFAESARPEEAIRDDLTRFVAE